MAFSSDGNMLATGSRDGTVLLWELAPTSVASERIAADINNDGVVNIIDLTLVASNFGEIGQTAADVNGDGVVNIIDLTLVAGAFGNTAGAPVTVGSRPRDRSYKRPSSTVAESSAANESHRPRFSAWRSHLGTTPCFLNSAKRRHCCQTIRIRSILRRGYPINSQCQQMSAFPSIPPMESWFGGWTWGISLWESMNLGIVRRIGTAGMHSVNLLPVVFISIHCPRSPHATPLQQASLLRHAKC